MSSTVSLCTEISATKVPDKKLDPPTATRDRVELSVVMPCLNERETVGICVLKAMAALRQAGISGEVIVADNGSIDGSVEIAQTEGARVVNVAEKGYGNAVKGGILTSRGDYILMADSDDSYELSHIPRFVEQLRAGSDLVMGNRFSGGIARQAMPFLHRYLGNPVLTGIGRLFFRSPCEGLSLRHASFSQGQFPADGYTFDGHGIRQRDGRQSQFVADEGQRGAHDPVSGRAQPSAAPAHLA